MIIRILIVVSVILAVLWGISVYLGPDDLRSCNIKPSADASTNTECKPVDAIVAVSGGDTAARTAEAVKLYQNGWAGKLIFSGAAADKSGPSNAEVMRREAIDMGVPGGAVIIDALSETTSENAINTKDIADQYNLQSIIVVTSAYHQRRTSMEFEKRLTNVRVLSHPVPYDNQWSGLWWTTPYGWWLATSELMKILIISVGGKLS